MTANTEVWTPTDWEWLENRLRSISLIRSNGEDEHDGMWRCTLALWGHHSVGPIFTWSLQQLVEIGRKAEGGTPRPTTSSACSDPIQPQEPVQVELAKLSERLQAMTSLVGQTKLAELAEQLRTISVHGPHHLDDWKVFERAADAIEQLAKHEQQGGITMTCGHPIQCAYPEEGGTHCSMCDLVAKAGHGCCHCDHQEGRS